MPNPKKPPDLLLGTAMWGWTTPRATAFQLLDSWYGHGYRDVDTATNYPIDKNPGHFRLAEKILFEWIAANGVTDLRVMMKIGSLNNLRTPENLLTKSFWLMMTDEYRHMFGENLHTMMVHWDNRDDAKAIRDTLEAIAISRQKGLEPGLSGIKHPEIYADINKDFQFDFRIQIKHNVLHSDYDRYAPFHGKRRFITYGINAGGLKLDPEKYTENASLAARGGNIGEEPEIVQNIRDLINMANTKTDRLPVDAFHQIGMINAYYHPDVQGILLGPSTTGQLNSSIAFCKAMEDNDYSDVWEQLRSLNL